jgi:dTDP-4-dehydrorhamnose 3,5-epimerase
MTRRPLEDFAGPRLVRHARHTDPRGYFDVQWTTDELAELGLRGAFRQQNLAASNSGTLRGLHYQLPTAQGKLVSIVCGAVFDVLLDMRQNSATRGDWAGIHLCAADPMLLWVPPGFAHGYQALQDGTLTLYLVDAPYRPKEEVAIHWRDSTLAIDWPIETAEVSPKDSAGLPLDAAPTFPWPELP